MPWKQSNSKIRKKQWNLDLVANQWSSSAIYFKKTMLLAVVILSKLIIKACHRTENSTHQRKLEVAVTEGKTVLLYKEQSLENCLNETLYSVLSAKIRLQYRAVVIWPINWFASTYPRVLCCHGNQFRPVSENSRLTTWPCVIIEFEELSVLSTEESACYYFEALLA